MARIPLTEGFQLIPEGTYVFRIESVEYKEAFGKMEIKMKTETNRSHTERFSLLGSNGKPNEGAMNAFSFFAKTAMNDYTLTEIDESELVGKYIEADVYHDQVESKKDGRMLTFAHLGDKRPASGFGTVEKPNMDLASILG
jgi:hypothetical protein